MEMALCESSMSMFRACCLWIASPFLMLEVRGWKLEISNLQLPISNFQIGGERMQKVKEKGPRPEKVREVEDLKQILATSKSAVLADYRGLNVKSMSTLRKRLRESEAGIRVVKNTLLKRAAEGSNAETLVADLEGPTALAYSDNDPVSVAKVLAGFIKEFKLPVIKGGLAEGHIMGPDQIKALAAMPPRQVLIAQVVGGLQSPVTSFVGTLQQLYAGFVYTLQGVVDKKQ